MPDNPFAQFRRPAGGAVFGPPPEEATPVERERLGNEAERIRLDREKAEREEREWNATHNPDGTPKASAGLSRTQLGQARQKLVMLRNLEGQMQRVEAAARELQDDGWAGPVWGNIPGTGSLDPESARYDKAIASLTAQIRQLTRTPGEGAMSDYESRLAAAIPPARSDNSAAREEAMAGIRDLIATTRAGYEELVGEEPAQTPARRNSRSNPDDIEEIMRRYGD